MKIIDHVHTEVDAVVVVTLGADNDTVAVTSYDPDPTTGNSMLLEQITDMLLLNLDEAERIGQALLDAVREGQFQAQVDGLRGRQPRRGGCAMSICSFSGTHDWHPSVLNDTDVDDGGDANRIIDNIESGTCPRCERPLPQLPEYPAGSRVTECRSIPICGRCGSDEAFESMDAASGIGLGLSGPSWWPIPVEEIEERRIRHMQHVRPAILTGDGHLITEDGSIKVINPRNTGGWAQYGWEEGGPS